MNKFLRAIVFTGAILFTTMIASQADAAAKYGDKVLQNGSEGPEVMALQQDLRTLGYFTFQKNTGYYGEITEAAVKAFQKDYAIEQTGKVGHDTAANIEDAAAKKAEELKKAMAANGGLVESAKKLLGIPYQWNGNTPAGFDCSGFVKYIFAQKNIDLPRTSQEMFGLGTAVADPQPGDLVFFSTYDSSASHVGIYIGDNQFISSTSTYGVKIDSFSNPYWGPRYIGAKRL